MNSQNLLVAYSMFCTWWDSKDKVGLVSCGGEFPLPVCPGCGSPLFEMTRSEWDAAIAKYATEHNDPSYADMVFWGRGKCFPRYGELKKQWQSREGAA